MCLLLVQPPKFLIHQEASNLVSVFLVPNSQPVLGGKGRETMSLCPD